MGDRLRAGKLSRCVTSHPGQLSLATPLWVGAMSTSLGWEGNLRSGVALAMRHVVYPPTSSTAYEIREMSAPPTLLRSMALIYVYLYRYLQRTEIYFRGGCFACQGLGAAWHLADIEVEETSTGQRYLFPCSQWLSTSKDDKQICRELTCANLQSPRAKDRLCEHTSTRICY